MAQPGWNDSLPEVPPAPSLAQGSSLIPPASPPAFPRLPGETPRAFSAFMTHFQLGQARSLAAVADKLGESPGTVKNWSSKHASAERLQACQAGLLQEQARHHAALHLQQAAIRGHVVRFWLSHNPLLCSNPSAWSACSAGRSLPSPKIGPSEFQNGSISDRFWTDFARIDGTLLWLFRVFCMFRGPVLLGGFSLVLRHWKLALPKMSPPGARRAVVSLGAKKGQKVPKGDIRQVPTIPDCLAWYYRLFTSHLLQCPMAGLAGFWNFFETCQNLPKPAIGYVCLGKSQSAFFASSSSGNQVLSAATVHLENGGQRYAARC